MSQNIQSLKLFYEQDQIRVALFAEASESSDGWLQNLSCEEVFVEPPYNLAFEVPIAMEEISSAVTFQPAFLAGWLGTSPEASPPPLNPSASTTAEGPAVPKPISLAAYCNRISRQTGLPPGVVRKACEPLLKGIVKQINSGTPFSSWILTGTPDEFPAEPGSYGQPAKPARKFMRMEVTKGYKG